MVESVYERNNVTIVFFTQITLRANALPCLVRCVGNRCVIFVYANISMNVYLCFCSIQYTVFIFYCFIFRFPLYTYSYTSTLHNVLCWSHVCTNKHTYKQYSSNL